VAIDHIQILEDGSDSKRNQELDRMARDLKRIAKSFDTTVVVLSQINRATSQGQNKRPTLASIRDSSAIVTHADVVLGLYRDEMYNPDTIDRGIAEIIVLKNRNGAIGTCKTLFDAIYLNFRNLRRIEA
jgi:replicative DNA helicase